MVEKFIVVIPYTRLFAAGILLGAGLVVGIKVGSTLLKVAVPHLGKLGNRLAAD